MKSRTPRIIIVGAGPAGIFAAQELGRRLPGAKIRIFEKGRDIDRRSCPQRERGGPSCLRCSPCSVLSGWGGAGAYSDGKLIIAEEIGGSLASWIDEAAVRAALLRDVEAVYLRFGAPRRSYRASPAVERGLRSTLERAHLRLVTATVRHLGTDGCRALLLRMRRALPSGVEVLFDRTAERILVAAGAVRGVLDDRGREHRADFVLLAPGRSGAEWLRNEAARIGLPFGHHAVDLGVRVEVPASVTAVLTDRLYEAKILYTSPTFDDPVRTFCMCPHGEVVQENNDGVTLVNGQSWHARRTDRTNFAVLVSTRFTEPFREPIAYGKYIAHLANLLSGGVLVQRLGDLLSGRRSTPERISRGVIRPSLETATPGDLSFALPYRHLTGVIEMIRALGRAVPGLDSPETLLYGVEAKFYSLRLELNHCLETPVRNLFAAGDGAGVSRGLVQASASGLATAREIIRRCGGGKR